MENIRVGAKFALVTGGALNNGRAIAHASARDGMCAMISSHSSRNDCQTTAMRQATSVAKALSVRLQTKFAELTPQE
jgi:NAD(P)-dependent dehydrogenase (short-subunit alcohol dehydrogenase family)